MLGHLEILDGKIVHDILFCCSPPQIRDNLNLEGQECNHAIATLACFLVQEGADQYIANKHGLTPLQRCPAELATVIVSFEGPKGGR